MTQEAKLNIPDVETRVRRTTIREILNWLVTHEVTLDQATSSIEHLMAVERMNITGRTRAGNDISGI